MPIIASKSAPDSDVLPHCELIDILQKLFNLCFPFQFLMLTPEIPSNESKQIAEVLFVELVVSRYVFDAEDSHPKLMIFRPDGTP